MAQGWSPSIRFYQGRFGSIWNLHKLVMSLLNRCYSVSDSEVFVAVQTMSLGPQECYGPGPKKSLPL